MRKISASELSSYSYCHRSWWYAKQGEISENQSEIALGKRVHHAHSRKVKFSILIRNLSILLLLVGLAILLWSLFS